MICDQMYVMLGVQDDPAQRQAAMDSGALTLIQDVTHAHWNGPHGVSLAPV